MALTVEQKAEKDAALLEVKNAAVDAAKEALPALIAAGLKAADAQLVIKGIAEDIVASLEIKEKDGKKTALTSILEGMQKQYDDLALEFKNKGVDMQTKGNPFMIQLKEQFEANKDALQAVADQKAGVVSFDIKAVAPLGLGNFGDRVIPGFREPGIDKPEFPESFIFNLITTMNGGVGSNPLTWVEMVPKEGTPAWTAENALKPGMDWTYKENKATAEMIAVWTAITRQALLNWAILQQEVNIELARQLRHALDKAILNGDGTNNTPFGIKYYAIAFAPSPALAGKVVNANRTDVIRAAVGQVRKGASVASADLGGFNPNYALVSHDTATLMDVEKNVNGTYVIPPYTNADGSVVAGVTLIESNFIADDEFIVGDFTRYLFNIVDGVRLDVGYVNDQFIRNQLTVRCELYGTGRVRFNERPAFVKGTFTAAIAALTVPAI